MPGTRTPVSSSLNRRQPHGAQETTRLRGHRTDARSRSSRASPWWESKASPSLFSASKTRMEKPPAFLEKATPNPSASTRRIVSASLSDPS